MKMVNQSQHEMVPQSSQDVCAGKVRVDSAGQAIKKREQ